VTSTLLGLLYVEPGYALRVNMGRAKWRQAD